MLTWFWCLPIKHWLSPIGQWLVQSSKGQQNVYNQQCGFIRGFLDHVLNQTRVALTFLIGHDHRLEWLGKRFSSWKQHQRTNITTNLRVVPLVFSSGVGIGLETHHSLHLQFLIEPVILEEWRKITNRISTYRCFIAAFSAAVSSFAASYCASCCCHAW